jgi:hypothetical protein
MWMLCASFSAIYYRNSSRMFDKAKCCELFQGGERGQLYFPLCMSQYKVDCNEYCEVSGDCKLPAQYSL